MIHKKQDIQLYLHGKQPVWYYRFRVKKEKDGFYKTKEIRRSTGLTDIKAAREEAWRDYLRESGQDVKTQRVPRMQIFPTVGTICGLYESKIVSIARIQEQTAHRNVMALKRIISVGLGVRNPYKSHVTVLNEDLVIKFRTARYKAVGREYDKGDDLKLNYSLNSYLRKSQSVFSKKAIRLYNSEGFKLPDISGYMKIEQLAQDDTKFIPISESTDRRMIGDANKDLANDFPEIFVVFELARFCGLRSGEISSLRWHWFVKSKHGYDIAIVYRTPRTDPGKEEFKPKSRNRWAPVSAKRVNRWKKLLPPESETAYVIPGVNKTERAKLIEREACNWVARYIPDRNKRVHELRKQAGSDIATRQGLMAAAQFLGDSMAVTEKHYASLLSAVLPL